MRAQDLMTTPVHTTTMGTSADDAWELMRMKRVHHLVVVDGKAIAGVLSDRDIGGRHGASVRKGRTVSDLMTEPVVTVTPTTTVRQAANLLRGRSIGCLVVADKGRVAGIVTTADLLELLGRGVDRPVLQATRWTLKHRAPHRKQHRATGVW